MLEFLKREIANSKLINLESELINRASPLPKHSYFLIKGESNSGKSSLSLEYISRVIREEPVVFLDYSRVLNHRNLKGLENLIIYRPYHSGPKEILEALEEFRGSSTLVLDDLDLVRKSLEISWETFSNFLLEIRKNNPEMTVIGTQRNRYSLKLWSSTLEVSHEKNYYLGEGDDRICYGSLISLKGIKGKSQVFLDHRSGRISKVYESVKLEIESGKSKSSTFSYNGISRQGAWKLIEEYET